MMNKIRLTAIFLAAATAMALAACAKSGGNESAPAGATSAEAVTATGTGDTAEVKDTADAAENDYSDFSYSEGLKADGYFEGVRALDIVTLPDYSAIEVPASDAEVTDTEIESRLSSLLAEHQIENKITDRAVEDGDTVNIDYVGSVDGVEFEGGSTQGQGTDVTIGVTSYIDDFLEQLIGHKPGETVNVEVTFPDPYQNNTELSGKDALFVTTINYITEKVTPELTDDFVAENLTEQYGWKTADEVKTGVADQLREQKLTSFVRTWIVDNAEVGELPESHVEHQKNAMLNYYSQYASAYGVSLEDLVSQQGYDSIDAMVEEQKASLENAAKELLVLQAVAEDAGLTVTKDEMKAFLKDNVGASSDDDVKSYVERFGEPYLMQVTLNEKVYDLLAKNAVISESAETETETEANQ